jgi:hypothetical protein
MIRIQEDLSLRFMISRHVTANVLRWGRWSMVDAVPRSNFYDEKIAGPLAKRQEPRAFFAFVLAFIMLATAPAPAAEPGVLTLETTIPLPDVRGRIDHMAIDRARQRLIVAGLGNNTVEVADLATGKPIQRLRGHGGPQGVAYADKADLIFVASAGDGSVRIFQAADLTALGGIDRHQDAGKIRIDPRNGNIIVGYGDGALATILVPSFDPECTSEHGNASINVQHLSRNETCAPGLGAGCRYLVYASDTSHRDLLYPVAIAVAEVRVLRHVPRRVHDARRHSVRGYSELTDLHCNRLRQRKHTGLAGHVVRPVGYDREAVPA